MDILNRISKMRLERGWSEYELAKRSGLPQSTISSWYRKNMSPTVTSLSKICDAYGISLSYFFLEESDDRTVSLSQPQFYLLEYAARLDPVQFDSLIRFLTTLHPDVENA